jgi:LysM repeat protein
MRPIPLSFSALGSALGALLSLACANPPPFPFQNLPFLSPPLDSPREQPAQQPAPPPRNEHYVVQTGDTLYSIARSQGTSVAALEQANALVDPDRLVVGQLLVLPSPGAKPMPTTARPRPRVARTVATAAAAPPPARATAPARPASKALLPVDCAILDTGESLRSARFEQALSEAKAARSLLRPLESQPGAAERTARLEVLAGMAEVALGHDVAARASFARALDADPLLRLEPNAVSPKILRIFEETRAERPEQQARR